MTTGKKLSFETTILQIGNNTGICIPDEIVEGLGAGKRPPVHVTINDYTYRNTIAVMGGKFMIGISADIRSKTAMKGGDQVQVQLELDTDPREVVMPAAFKEALDKNTAAKAFFESLSYSNKQRYVMPVTDAKTDETRQRRIDKAMADLSAGKK